MLLHGRGYVLLKNAVPEKLVTELRTVFRDIFIDCKASMGDEKSREITVGAATKTIFWQRNSRFRIFPRLTGPFSNRLAPARSRLPGDPEPAGSRRAAPARRAMVRADARCGAPRGLTGLEARVTRRS
jgi:hypothetical protein